ncbi:MAG: hypothetical protein IJO14_02585, partial [Clostridia bacterium]|nr:hypothetical protein [Clostridia bacterium]
WVLEKEELCHTISLRFTINSDITYEGALLALEDAEKAEIVFNGEKVANDITGWYVDKDIKTVALPVINKGVNTLVITWPIGATTNTEWCYILGNFGVNVAGTRKTITTLPEKLYFDALRNQQLPFYGGNVTYHLQAKGNNIALEATRYVGTLMKVTVDGEEKGRIIYPPYSLLLKDLGDGMHNIDITLFGNRFNSFGAVHLSDNKHSWHGPDSWRTRGCTWSYEYVLRDVGILTRPVLWETE